MSEDDCCLADQQAPTDGARADNEKGCLTGGPLTVTTNRGDAAVHANRLVQSAHSSSSKDPNEDAVKALFGLINDMAKLAQQSTYFRIPYERI